MPEDAHGEGSGFGALEAGVDLGERLVADQPGDEQLQFGDNLSVADHGDAAAAEFIAEDVQLGRVFQNQVGLFDARGCADDALFL